jgi:5-oxoprolinase (ATP-hydrolysing)
VLFFVASRAHHADVGGITPGSMPPHSRTIDEEGVLLIGPNAIVRAASCVEDRTCADCSSPARDPARNSTRT